MKRPFVALLGIVIAFGIGTLPQPAVSADPPTIEVWRSRTCGCCKAWVRHVEEAGFLVRQTEVDDVEPKKRELKVPPELSSCHTALVVGYVVEGHVPAADIVRLLKDRPKIRGIYVPGMPIGSPGMEGPNGKPYPVFALDDEGKTSVFATHQP
jgi:hypothetical protein